MKDFIQEKEYIAEKVASEVMEQLNNLNIDNASKVLILFAGIPCSGKSKLAMELETEFKGVRISRDAANKVIHRDYKSYQNFKFPEIWEVTREAVGRIMEKVKSSPNHLLILDTGIERKFEWAESWAKENGYQIFVIAVKRNEKEIVACMEKERLEAKEYYLASYKRWKNDFESFSKNFNYDFELNTSAEYEKQKEDLFNKIKERIGE